MTGGPFIQCPVLMNRYRGRYAFYDRFLREVYRWCGIFDVVVMNVCPPERVPRGSFLEVKTMLLSLPKVYFNYFYFYESPSSLICVVEKTGGVLFVLLCVR